MKLSCICSQAAILIFSLYLVNIAHADVGAFRIECTATRFGEPIKAAFEYKLNKFPKYFSVGYDKRSKSDNMVAYNLVEIKYEIHEDIKSAGKYLLVHFNDSPYNDPDYPNHKYITLNKLSFWQDNSLGLHSAKISIDGKKVESATSNEDKNFRNCISIGVW